ncbi:MerR family transcriptional regulator [Metabacillus fastidiosus]|uniref:MerR family transcriptional regulator n=1 Tax=Metabacillus fastidiosus TaxID=1458 RepID=UPI003D2B8DAB
MEYYTIGQVSKLCKIPTKTLRYYDEIDLLKPEKVSLETKYRYYSQNDILKIPVIKYYKQLGFQLKDIKNLIRSLDVSTLESYFTKELAIVEKQIQELNNKHFAMTQWFQLLKQGEMLSKETELFGGIKIYTSVMPVYRTIHYQYKVHEKREHIESIFSNSFVEFCSENDIFTYGPFILKFQHYEERIQNCYSTINCYSEILGEHEDMIQIGNIRAVNAIHKGDYSQIPITYKAVLQWVKTNNIQLQGITYERYIIDRWCSANSEEFITELIFPIQEKIA